MMGNPADIIIASAIAFAIMLGAYKGAKALGRWAADRADRDFDRKRQ